MLVASRISGNSLVNDLCCLVTCVVWHVFHVGMMEMEECGSTFNRDWHARVVQALHLRLEKVVSMAGEGGPHIQGVPGEGELRGNDAEGDRADRSRSPARAALGAPGAALGAPGAALGAPGAALGAPGAAFGSPWNTSCRRP